MTNSRPTQCEKVLKYLQDFGSITQLDALADLGIMRLGARIYNLRQNGIDIERRMKTVVNRYGEKCSIAEYFLPKTVDNHETV